MTDPAGDTIVATATPPGQGAVAVVRLSGPRAIAIADRRFRGATPLRDAPRRHACYGRVVDADGQHVDDVLAICFAAPASYTGEEVVEISCHGSPLIAQRITELMSASGARFAEPGEYTRRAFLNGKIDLAQAEAVGELIASASNMALRGARGRLDGELSRHVGGLREHLVELAALTELDLDFAEEEVPVLAPAVLAAKINAAVTRCEEMLATFRVERMLRDGVQVALVGKPNVGKSSLLNRLARESRALVSDVPGTTRDAVHADIQVDGVHLRVTDTAGLHDSADVVETMGMQRTHQTIDDADLVVVVVECGGHGRTATYETNDLPGVSAERLLVVANKCDLGPAPPGSDRAVSALSGEGIEALAGDLVRLSFRTNPYSETTTTIASERQKRSLEDARIRLQAAAQLARAGDHDGDLIAAELRAAITGLEELLGEVTSDNVLNQIFAEFCIGK